METSEAEKFFFLYQGVKKTAIWVFGGGAKTLELCVLVAQDSSFLHSAVLECAKSVLVSKLKTDIQANWLIATDLGGEIY